MENTREFEQYLAYNHIIGNFAMIAQRLEGNAQLSIGQKMLQPALEGVEKIKTNETQKIDNIEDIPDEFKNYGTSLLDQEYEEWELPFN